MKNDAYLSKSLMTPRDIARLTATPLNTVLKQCEKEQGLFEKNIQADTILSRETLKRLCQLNKHNPINLPLPEKTYSQDQQRVAQSAGAFSLVYASHHLESKSPLGVKIASHHRLFHDAIEDAQNVVNSLKGPSLKSVQKELNEVSKFHETHERLHSRQTSNSSQKMENFHRNSRIAIKIGLEKTQKTPEQAHQLN
jgi:hypothetical protein